MRKSDEKRKEKIIYVYGLNFFILFFYFSPFVLAIMKVSTFFQK